MKVVFEKNHLLQEKARDVVRGMQGINNIHDIIS